MSPEINGRLVSIANAFPGNLNAKPDFSKSDALFVEVSTAERKCARWRRESVPVGLREKGRESRVWFSFAASIEACVA